MKLVLFNNEFKLRSVQPRVSCNVTNTNFPRLTVVISISAESRGVTLASWTRGMLNDFNKWDTSQFEPGGIRWPPTAFHLRLRPFVFYNYGSFMSFSRTRFPVDFCQLVIAQVSGFTSADRTELISLWFSFHNDRTCVHACMRACVHSPFMQIRIRWTLAAAPTLDKGYSISQPNLARSLCFD